jgi:hypothetical protein
MPPQSNKNLYFLLGLILLIVITLLVISLYSLVIPSSSDKSNPLAPNQNYTFFDQMNASVTGEITNISGSKVTIKNKKGQTKDFKVAQTTDLSKMETGKEVIINFIFVAGELEVSSVFPAATIPGAPPLLPPKLTPPATSSGTAPPALP